ncbi:CocE/NonD family hydrolase [Streptomyces sp. SAS_270]|uniref:CocE/NonD family hydrolase n=1 Tax=Streptomyces sp. SAS_270 TaxID=3412748 RepID=UPI00403CBA3E
MSHLYEKSTIAMRDGTALSAIVFRPSSGQAPALLIRTPYGITASPWAGNGGAIPSLVAFLDAGYAVVWVECRGTHGSEGEFVPLVDETDDGFDTLEWIVGQPWSNGAVGMYGPSYSGMTQWAAAGSGHPALKAIVPMMSAMNWYRGTTYSRGGAYSPTIASGWAAMMEAADEVRSMRRGQGDPAKLAELSSLVVDGSAVAEAAPLASHPALGRVLWFQEFVTHPSMDGFWEARDLSLRIHRMTAPALMIGGWYDFFLAELLSDFRRFQHEAATDDARQGSRLLIGPWDHFDLQMNAHFPDRDFGLGGSGQAADITGEHLAHFDRWLTSEPARAQQPAPRVRIFVMGTDEWREADAWPFPGTRDAAYYLDDGLLTPLSPAQDIRHSYVYDPRDPVRHGDLSRLSAPYQPSDHAGDEERPDVLSFATAPLAHPVEVIGHVSATLFVSTDARDTDFTARLIDVHPDGRAIGLCDGIVRLRYRKSLAMPEPVVPGTVYEVTIDMAATANVFLPGHRIRVDISSSNFPRYDRNTNTGGDIATESLDDAVAATNTLRIGPEYPSRVILPIVTST